jgi:ATP-dependent Clp protease ATP-binding subunit ClpA
MDYGKLTDHNGKTIDFRNVILIMTTNAGAIDVSKNKIGFNAKRSNDASSDAINRIFSPEFRNRIDSIIHFNHLSKNIVLSIVDKFIIEIEAQLEDKGVSLSINKEAKELLADDGYDEVYGARELGRVIQEKVKKPMAEELIFGKLAKGGHVEITCKDKKIAFEFSNKQEVKKELA